MVVLTLVFVRDAPTSLHKWIARKQEFRLFHFVIHFTFPVVAFGREPTVSFVDIWFKALIDVEEQNIISLSGSAGGCGENPLVRQTTCSSRRDVYSAWQGEARFGFFGKRNT